MKGPKSTEFKRRCLRKDRIRGYDSRIGRWLRADQRQTPYPDAGQRALWLAAECRVPTPFLFLAQSRRSHRDLHGPLLVDHAYDGGKEYAGGVLLPIPEKKRGCTVCSLELMTLVVRFMTSPTAGQLRSKTSSSTTSFALGSGRRLPRARRRWRSSVE